MIKIYGNRFSHIKISHDKVMCRFSLLIKKTDSNMNLKKKIN